jgi:hypothetical protein
VRPLADEIDGRRVFPDFEPTLLSKILNRF